MQPTIRISKEKGYLMIGTAILLDLIGTIPVLNFATAAAELFIFPFWFSLSGVSYSKNHSMWWWTIGAAAIGLIPGVSSVLPELTAGVIRNVVFVWNQDKKAMAKFEQEKIGQVNKDRESAKTRAFERLNARYGSNGGINEMSNDSNQPQNTDKRVDSIRRAA